MTNPSVESGQSLLRPRWRAWLRATGETLFLWLVMLASLMFNPDPPRYWVVFVQGFLVLSPLGFIYMIWSEYRRKPPVMSFWKDVGGAPVAVRKRQTGAVLIESRDGNLTDQDIAGVSLVGASLSGLNLRWLDLRDRDVAGADLRHAVLTGAKLSGARLSGANLESANLANAQLYQADLRQARLASANLTGADLRGADLRGTDFVGRSATLVLWDQELGRAQFTGAICDATTRWPIGFDYVERGCVLVIDDSARLPIPANLGETAAEQLPVPATTPP